MIKRFVLIYFLTAIGYCGTQAQYYYKDILSNRQVITDLAAYKQHKVKTINIRSYESDGSPSAGFSCKKTFSGNYLKSTLFTRSNISGASLQTSLYNAKGLLLKMTDSSDIAVTTNSYQYDDLGKITTIFSSVRSQDDDFTNEMKETHLYIYGTTASPEQMIRIRNQTDSTVILFATDDKGNIMLEKDTKSGTKFYYYYDAKNRITDIVQENDFATRMLPDYIFEYNNSAGLLSQMTTTEEGGNYYYIWKYTYDDGLRVLEKCFGKDRRLLGRIEYEYK